MGLSDIDEDEPVTHSPGRPIVLAPPTAAPPAVIIPTGTPINVSYGGGSGVATAASAGKATTPTNTGHVKTGVAMASPSASASGGSVLDDLFGSMDVNASPSSARANASPTSMSSSLAAKPASTTAAAATTPSVLDDLFAAAPTATSKAAGSAGARGGLGDRQGSGASATEGQAMLYVDGSSGGAADDGTNLFDLSKPVKKDKYSNAESFLDAFERQGKKGGGRTDERETLANLTRNKDDNKVRARLLALMNYYDVLGVAPTASEEEIKRSYKKKALELHPDRVGRSQTQEEAELFKVITKAHEVLTDASQRREYDASLRGGQQPGAAASANDWWSHVNM